MKKKGVLSIMMAVAMAASLAGCGSSGTDAGSGEPTKTAEVSSEKRGNVIRSREGCIQRKQSRIKLYQI
ncbi:MAG: hypothetical protein ACLR0U_31460 [Enterocloster clostridioformis]